MMMVTKGSTNLLAAFNLALRVKGRGQIGSLSLNLKPTNTHYQIKLHQKLTRSFQIIGNFLSKKILEQRQTSMSNIAKI